MYEYVTSADIGRQNKSHFICTVIPYSGRRLLVDAADAPTDILAIKFHPGSERLLVSFLRGHRIVDRLYSQKRKHQNQLKALVRQRKFQDAAWWHRVATDTCSFREAHKFIEDPDGHFNWQIISSVCIGRCDPGKRCFCGDGARQEPICFETEARHVVGAGL